MPGSRSIERGGLSRRYLQTMKTRKHISHITHSVTLEEWAGGSEVEYGENCCANQGPPHPLEDTAMKSPGCGGYVGCISEYMLMTKLQTVSNLDGVPCSCCKTPPTCKDRYLSRRRLDGRQPERNVSLRP